MAVIDCITYNGEAELFDLRYNILKDYVDKFIVVEFDETFSGKRKPYYFEGTHYIFKDKVDYFRVTQEDWEQYRELAEASPNTVGAEHWKREFMQKESIKDCLIHLKDDDIVFIGDCDEIWDPHEKHEKWVQPMKLMLRVYTYYLNQRSSEHFWGIMVARYKDIKEYGSILNHLRTHIPCTEKYYGWHFTSMGGSEAVRKKLNDSYTDETYASAWVLNNLDENIKRKRDFLGRNFEYWIDESEWPQYLKDNKEKYAHLCK